jgi:hypothetical protein
MERFSVATVDDSAREHLDTHARVGTDRGEYVAARRLHPLA